MADKVNIRYPTEGSTVPGGGGLFAWGNTEGGLQAETAQAKVTSRLTRKKLTNSVVKVDAPAPNTWAFRISGLTTGDEATLTVTANDMMGGVDVPQDVNFTVG